MMRRELEIAAVLAAAGCMSLQGGRLAAEPRSAAKASNSKAAAPAAADPQAKATSAQAESGMTLRGDQDGTAFRSLTVEGEDRIHFEIERPSLDLSLDPSTAPGLDWGSVADALDRTVPDAVGPYLRNSTASLSPYLGRPWLRVFASGDVARFHPQVENIESWRLLVVDSRGETVTTFQGKGKPPAEIAWDGRAANGTQAQPGRTYSYVLEARDRAGNKRNFVGQGFELPPYRVQSPTGPVVAFTGDKLPVASGTDKSTAAPGAVLEAASWMNQIPAQTGMRITATARSFEQANALMNVIARSLAPFLVGNAARVQAQAQVEPDACPSGTVRIAATP